jgi:hypothetical protein
MSILYVRLESISSLHIRLAYDKRIQRDRPASDALAQSPYGVDHDFVRTPGDWIGTEYNHRNNRSH